jgi:hypothetical protein
MRARITTAVDIHVQVLAFEIDGYMISLYIHAYARARIRVP